MIAKSRCVLQLAKMLTTDRMLVDSPFNLVQPSKEATIFTCTHAIWARRSSLENEHPFGTNRPFRQDTGSKCGACHTPQVLPATTCKKNVATEIHMPSQPITGKPTFWLLHPRCCRLPLCSHHCSRPQADMNTEETERPLEILNSEETRISS